VSVTDPEHVELESQTLTKLVCALATPEDHLAEDPDLLHLLSRLSARDRNVIAGISRRIVALAKENGPETAEKALSEVVAILCAERSPCA